MHSLDETLESTWIHLK